MQKTKVKVLAALLVAGVLCTENIGALAASDPNKIEQSQTYNGVTVTWGCSMTENSGFASTVANTGYIWTTTEATYHTVNINATATSDERYEKYTHSNSGYYGSSVSFSASDGYKSLHISSDHTANVPLHPIEERTALGYIEN